MKRFIGYLMLAIAGSVILGIVAFVTGGPGRWHYTLGAIAFVAVMWFLIVKGVEWTTP
jgi:arginine exporter protein ArgO